MIRATSSLDGPPLTFNVTVAGVPIYLDNDSLIELAKGDPDRRESLRQGAKDLDAALIAKIAGYRGEADRDPAWLDQNFPKLKFNPSKPATFTYVNLVRGLVLDARAFQLKKGDGCDFCHAVVGGTFASFATLDGQWKRRFTALPQPNTLAKIYYRPELDQLVSDVHDALEQLKARRA